jgi:hypothetical protein
LEIKGTKMNMKIEDRKTESGTSRLDFHNILAHFLGRNLESDKYAISSKVCFSLIPTAQLLIKHKFYM